MIPQADMMEFLSNPLTGALYIRYFCVPIFKELSIDYCKQVAANPGLIKNSTFTQDTQKLAREMCGQNQNTIVLKREDAEKIVV